jgi:two-component system sensor histidine kinase VicK
VKFSGRNCQHFYTVTFYGYIYYVVCLTQLKLVMNIKIASILAGITERADEVYFIYNVDEKKLEHLSPAFEFITYVEKDVILKNPSLLLKVIHPDDYQFLKEKFEVIITDNEPSVISFRIIREDGQQRWVKLDVYPGITNNVRYIAGVAEDDTPRRTSMLTMEKVTAWTNASLEILSHDLREPIGTMKMLASIIARKLPENQEVVKLTSMIEEIAQRNITLIQTLLRREQLVAKHSEIKRERLDIVWEVNQALAMYIEAQNSLQKHITFTHSHDKIFAEIDSLKFLQLVNNLVSNAIKFTAENGIIKIHLELLESTFLLTVEDDGIGIPQKIHPFLFQKYSEAGRPGVDGQESTGLGMWIVRNLVEEHYGKIWFESTEGSGTTFYIEIPLGENT